MHAALLPRGEPPSAEPGSRVPARLLQRGAGEAGPAADAGTADCNWDPVAQRMTTQFACRKQASISEALLLDTTWMEFVFLALVLLSRHDAVGKM